MLGKIFLRYKEKQKMKRDELLLKAAKNMRRPCSAGVLIDKRFIAALLRLRSEKRKGLDKPKEK